MIREIMLNDVDELLTELESSVLESSKSITRISDFPYGGTIK